MKNKLYYFVAAITLAVLFMEVNVTQKFQGNWPKWKKCTTDQEWSSTTAAITLAISLVFSLLWGVCSRNRFFKGIMILSFSLGLAFTGATLVQSMNYDNLCLIKFHPSTAIAANCLDINNRMAKALEAAEGKEEIMNTIYDPGLEGDLTYDQNYALAKRAYDKAVAEYNFLADVDCSSARISRDVTTNPKYNDNVNTIKTSNEQANMVIQNAIAVGLLVFSVVIAHFKKDEKEAVLDAGPVTAAGDFDRYRDSITY